jgi:hypothetical protein
MKLHISIMSTFLLFSTIVFSQNNDFKIEIVEHNILCETYYHINKDSLIVIKKYPFSISFNDNYISLLSNVNKRKFEKIISKYNLNLQSGSYQEGSSSYSVFNYDASISYQGINSTIHIDQGKNKLILDISDLLNHILPDHYKISYNKKYLKQ